jgi:alkanesulfonate monooxygenase SsuD/methylene tetrahydromethanopterin reductase-like flavin-dependent oxidoreductase (luciferase family)
MLPAAARGGWMKLDIFSELQKAKPWPPAHERLLLDEAIEQAKLADACGYGIWWNVEHHGAVEFSYSSAPELVPVLLAPHTKRLRFGHSGILAPFKINHPLRVAERAAFADLATGGRMEIGLARSGGTEWTAFGVDADTSRAQLREALLMLPRMWTEHSFKWESELLRIPERDVVPKPLQQPHPPLWQTCTSPDSFRMAGELGVGALATTLLSPLATLAQLFGFYREGLAACQPAGHFVNAQVAVFTFVHCAASKQDAIESRAGEAALWFVNAAPRVFEVKRSVWITQIRGALRPNDPAASASAGGAESEPDDDPNDPIPVIRLLNRQKAGETLDPEEVYEVLDAVESVVIGDPDRCREKMERYRAIGTDRLMCLHQFGALPQARILGSIRRAGEHLIPHFERQEAAGR